MKRCACGKFICYIMLCCILATLFLPSTLACGENEEYLLISKDNVIMYENTAVQAPMFVLQKTFYVQVIKLNYSQTYHYVSYNGVKGLVKISEVGSTTVTGVEAPYYTATSITAHVNQRLYTSPSFSAITEINAAGLSLTYLGKINGDKGSYDTPVWFAVAYANEVYYLHCSLTNNLGLLESTFNPVHPNSIKKHDTPTSADETENAGTASQKPKVDTVRILLICGMIVPAIIILFLLFKPRKRRSYGRSGNSGYYRRNRDDDYYDDDDYDDD